MSMNENLEVKVNEITDVIRGLSDKPILSSFDVNNLVNNLVQKVEDVNEASFDKLAGDVQETVINVLDERYNDLSERLSVFEEFIASVEKNVQNPKIETEITRILNDIEALHSKMNSQELQTEGLIKSFDAIKNSSNSGQITKLCDEIVSISKSYDSIADILNNNFQEFLRKVESQGSREELQRLRYFLESVEGNQNVLVSAMNAVNDKQEEIKNLIRQSSSSQNQERFESIQNSLNEVNKAIIDTTSKADLEIISDKINSAINVIAEFRRSFDDSLENDGRTVIQGQLNNIINKLEGLKLNNGSNVNEDIIRLYTSIAEFKDGLYAAINTQLNDIIASMDVQFDKISNATVNASLDTNEAIGNMTGEVQKTNSIISDALSEKTTEIKQDIQKNVQDIAITIVNSIKGDMANFQSELANLDNKEAIIGLQNQIENLRNASDTSTLLIELDKLKASLDLTSVQEQLALLDKGELLNTINQKLDFAIELYKNNNFADKLDELGSKINTEEIYAMLERIHGKIDFSTIEEKISSLREFLATTDFSGEISSIKQKLALIDNIGQELVSVKNVDVVLTDIKNQIEENFRINSQRTNENLQNEYEIKESLKSINQKLSELDYLRLLGLINEIKQNISALSSKAMEGNEGVLENKLDRLSETLYVVENKLSEQQSAGYILEFENLLSSINENLNNVLTGVDGSVSNLDSRVEAVLSNLNSGLESIGSKTEASIQEVSSLIENSAEKLAEKINSLNALLEEKTDRETVDVKEQLDRLGDTIKALASSPINEQLDILEQNILSSNVDNIKEIKDSIQDFQNTFENTVNSLKNTLAENIRRKNSENEGIIPLFDEFEAKLSEKFSSMEVFIEEMSGGSDEKLQAALGEKFNALRNEIKLYFAEILKQTIDSNVIIINEFVKNQISEVRMEIGNYLKQESEMLTSYFAEKTEISQKELLSKFNQLLSVRENSEARINLIKSITGSLGEITGGINTMHADFETNSEFLNALSGHIDLLNVKVDEISQRGGERNVEISLDSINETLSSLQNKIENADNSREEAFKALAENLETVNSKLNSSLEKEDLNVISGMLEQINSKLGDLTDNGEADRIYDSVRALGENIDLINRNTDETVKKEDLTSLKESINDTINSISFNISSLEDRISGGSDFKAEIALLEEILSRIGENVDSLNSANFHTKEDAEKNLSLIADKIDSLKNILDEIPNKTEEKLNEAANGLEYARETILSKINNSTDNIKEQITSVVRNAEEKIDSLDSENSNIRGDIRDGVNRIIDNVEYKVAEINANNEALTSKISGIILENGSNIENAVNMINEGLNSINSKISENKNDSDSDVINSIDDVSRDIQTLHSAIEKLADEYGIGNTNLTELVKQLEKSAGEISQSEREQREEIKNTLVSMLGEIAKNSKVDEIKECITNASDNAARTESSVIQNKMEEISGHIHTNINGTRDKIEEIKQILIDEMTRALSQIKDETEEMKLTVSDQLTKSQEVRDSVNNAAYSLEQKLQDKVSMMESLLDEGITRFDERAREVLYQNGEGYKETLDEKLESAISKLQSDFESKMNDIQKIIDDKVYEIVSRNNEIIKDEMKLRADVTLKDISKDFKDKISKIESVLVKNEESAEGETTEQSYTLADVESDIAKIRLGLEKNNKLSNFKEFAARLVELKNINLENAKISRVIGSDIMRFDGWLKNTTAKIDLLAAKIDKSEKIKMEDLKTRLIQSEKNQAMPQKLEEAIMSIYKKYRTQENKIDDMINKIDSISQRQSESFDAKEFIDLCYDNTKKTQELMSRMDGIEDKMDLIQAKIDHIISSCIDE